MRLLFDQNLSPLIDKSDVYSGMWVLAAVREGWIKTKENPGPTYYLQSLMKVADDNSLGGIGQSSPSSDFKGVKIDQTVNPAEAFNGSAPAEAGAVNLLD